MVICFAIAAAVGVTLGIQIPLTACKERHETTPITRGNTILLINLTDCQNFTNISIVLKEGKPRINDISTFVTSCDSLRTHVDNFTNHLVEIATPVDWLLEEDNYFLGKSRITTSLLISSNTNQTLFVCVLDLIDYNRLQKPIPVSERQDLVKEKNCTQIETDNFSQSQSVPSAAHYYLAVVSVTDTAPVTLNGQYNVSISKRYYNLSDFQDGEIKDCDGFSSGADSCKLNNLDYNTSSDNCVLLHAAQDLEEIIFDEVSVVAKAVAWTERNRLKIPIIALPAFTLGACVLVICCILYYYYRKAHVRTA